MAAKKIKIVLNTDTASADCGKFAAEAHGYQGKGCSQDLAVFETLGKIEKQTKKPEYRATQAQQIKATA